VKQLRVSKWFSLMVPLVAIATVVAHGMASAKRAAARKVRNFAKSARAASNSSGPEGQAFVGAPSVQREAPGTCAGPIVVDYDKAPAEILRVRTSYSLRRVREMSQPQQAQEVIALLLEAEQKGLSAEDYEAALGRAIGKLKPALAAIKADAARFDVALTVCVMRYISDLHIGKVNPKHFEFGLDVEANEIQFARIPKRQCVDASMLLASWRKWNSITRVTGVRSKPCILFGAREGI